MTKKTQTNQTCDIVQDLLPLYAENVASDSSRQLVEQHLQTCETCRTLLKQLTQPVVIPAEQDVQPLQSFQRSWRFKLFQAVAITTIVSICLFSAAAYLYFLEQPCNYEDTQIVTSYATNSAGEDIFWIDFTPDTVITANRPDCPDTFEEYYSNENGVIKIKAKVIKVTKLHNFLVNRGIPKENILPSIGVTPYWLTDQEKTTIITLEFADRTVQIIDGQLQE